MNERWVCKRCFADNDETNAACVRCGLIRGAEATETDQASWSAQAAAQADTKPAGWTKWLRLWWIPAIAVVLVVGYLVSARRDGSGQIESGGNVSVEDLRVGDCFDFADSDSDEFGSVNGVPCDEPHQYQIFHATTHETAAYPTDVEAAAIFESLCLGSAFETFVGATYLESQFEVDMAWPTEEGFSSGDRGYICYAFDPGDSELTDSLEGADR